MATRRWVPAMASFLLPGAGLFFLGRKHAACLNFVLVNAVLAIALLLGDAKLIEHFHYLLLGLAALSGGYAYGIAGSQAGQSRRLTSEAGA